MASHYDRLPSQYATRPTPLMGPSRGDPFYDRDRHLSYPAQPETDYFEEERVLLRRGDRLHYPSHPAQDYASPQRESRGEVWSQTSWPRQTPVYSARSSPPPPPVSAQYPRYYHDARPASPPQWEESARWENAPDERNFEPSAAWRHARREPSHRRLNSLLNPPPSPRTVEYHRREPVPVSVEPLPLAARDYAHYRPDHHPYDERRSAYYERPPIPETPALIPNDTYRQPHVERTLPSQWETHTYRPEIIPATRVSRSVVTRDYKRPRQESFSRSPHLPNNDSSYWTGEQGSISGRHSRQGSLQSSHSVGTVDRERTATGASPVERRNVYAESTPVTSPTKVSRNRWDGFSDEHEYSGDEPVSAMSLPAHTLRQTVNDITRARDVFRENDGRKIAVPRMASGYLAPDASNVIDQSVTSRPIPRPMERSQPVVRHAWDPSTDRFVPIMDSNVHEPRQAERRLLTGSPVPINRSTRTGQVNSIPYGRASHVQHSSPTIRNNEAYPPRGAVTVPTSTTTQASGSNRQGVMSVHDLVSPTPVKPQLSTTLSQEPSITLPSDDNITQVETSTKRGPVEQQMFASEASPQRIAHVQLSWQEETSFDRHAFAPSRTESIPGLIHQRSSSDEPSNVGYSQIATPEIYTPEPDGDGTLAEVEVQIADTTIYSPKPPILLQPGEKISKDGTMRILAPRPKAAEKDIAEILRKAITIRRTYDTQSREQRVNPILMDNLAKSDGPEQQIRSTTENLVEEVADRVLTQFEEEQQMNIRAALATKLAEERELLAEKQQRLRDEYLTLHRRWVAHCSQLDSLFKANDMQETLTQAGRTTRRSAATLGDAVRSDLEMEQIIATLGNEDLTDPNHLAVRNVATIPDMISVVKGKVDHLFDDTNNEVDDPESFYDPRSGYCDWTPEEEATFYQKYAEFPKQFGIISEFLPHKTSRQCVLYYYIHKKRIVDFRNAIHAGNGRRRKGVRKSKASALLADVAQADSKRPAGRGRRGRGGFAGRGRGGGHPPSSEDNGDGDSRAKRRRFTETPRSHDLDDAQSVDTDNIREASVLPPKKRRGRKPGPKPAIASESSGQSPAPGETKSAEGAETTSRRKPNSTTTYWSESDRETFMRLLALHGKDFKRISAALPNKTHVQVGNYYKNHNRELGLERIALAAANRLRSPSDRDRFVTVTRAEASQSRTPMDETPAGQLIDRQVADATSAVCVLSLEQNGRPGQSVLRASTNPRGVVKEPVIKVYNEHSFQPGGTNRPQGVIMTPNGQAAYTLDVVQQPAQPQEPSTGASATAPLNFAR